jgi:uncharacterized protein (TIGR02001 family)
MSSRKIAVATLLSTGLLLAGNAAAEVSGSIAVVSDYVFRGVSQTNEKPALQGGITWNHESGFYAGAWGSSISWLSDSDPEVSSQVELDGFIGYAGEFGDSGVGYDLAATYYWYPGDYPPGFTDPDTVELSVALSWSVLSAKYSYATTDLFGIPDSDGSSALDLGLGWEFDQGWSVGAGYGRQWVAGYGGDLDYDYWKLTGGKSFDNGFAIGVEWHDTDLSGVDDTWLVSLSKSF